MIRKKQIVRLFAKDITGDLVKDRQEVTVNWRAGQLVLDDPSFNGGKDLGPDPFSTVLYNTEKMGYHRYTLSVNMFQQSEPFKTSIFRTLSFGQPVTDEQKERLLWYPQAWATTHNPSFRLPDLFIASLTLHNRPSPHK